VSATDNAVPVEPTVEELLTLALLLLRRWWLLAFALLAFARLLYYRGCGRSRCWRSRCWRSRGCSTIAADGHPVQLTVYVSARSAAASE
jgi:hypothetical protein